MMDEDFGEIHPNELTFIFEPKKQISCIVNLISKSDRHVAFKVKTTNPKLYCVKPNKGILKPYSTCEVIVTRQACTVLPPADTVIKERFLIERVFVSEGMTPGEVELVFNSNGGCNTINVKKLKVVVDVIPKVEEMKSKSEERDLTVDEAKETVRMKSKIKELDLRLTEAEEMISKLKEQKSDCGCKGKKRRPCMFIKYFNVKLA
ncbi:hypothetical protein L2E82_15582 [Cichorium intybus]|uniref:Uncharacterized protein n=1 Tax=Cichorium intybus TaxID=13427 RepID=A0ACB9F3R4_CICIN|nr:hypothetical protein L2E82_15582 [Cichorium intybus]